MIRFSTGSVPATLVSLTRVDNGALVASNVPFTLTAGRYVYQYVGLPGLRYTAVVQSGGFEFTKTATEPPTPVAGGGLTLAEVLAMIYSPLGELITYTPAEGDARQIRAVVTRDEPTRSGELTVLGTRIFIARHETYGVLTVAKGTDRFTFRPQSHLAEREFVAEELQAGDYYFNLTVV